jgi:hypothetical protein
VPDWERAGQGPGDEFARRAAAPAPAPASETRAQGRPDESTSRAVTSQPETETTAQGPPAEWVSQAGAPASRTAGPRERLPLGRTSWPQLALLFVACSSWLMASAYGPATRGAPTQPHRVMPAMSVALPPLTRALHFARCLPRQAGGEPPSWSPAFRRSSTGQIVGQHRGRRARGGAVHPELEPRLQAVPDRLKLQLQLGPPAVASSNSSPTQTAKSRQNLPPLLTSRDRPAPQAATKVCETNPWQSVPVVRAPRFHHSPLTSCQLPVPSSQLKTSSTSHFSSGRSRPTGRMRGQHRPGAWPLLQPQTTHHSPNGNLCLLCGLGTQRSRSPNNKPANQEFPKSYLSCLPAFLIRPPSHSAECSRSLDLGIWILGFGSWDLDLEIWILRFGS